MSLDAVGAHEVPFGLVANRLRRAKRGYAPKVAPFAIRFPCDANFQQCGARRPVTGARLPTIVIHFNNYLVSY